MTRLASNMVWHPRVIEGCDRINARAKAENEAEDHAFAVERARKIIRDPRGVSDKNLRTACMWFMAHGDGGSDYLLADQHIYAINARERVARNRQAAVALNFAGLAGRAEEEARLDRYRRRLGGVTAGYLVAMAVVVVLAGLGWVRV